MLKAVKKPNNKCTIMKNIVKDFLNTEELYYCKEIKTYISDFSISEGRNYEQNYYFKIGRCEDCMRIWLCYNFVGENIFTILDCICSIRTAEIIYGIEYDEEPEIIIKN